MGRITHENVEVMSSAGEPARVPFDQSGYATMIGASKAFAAALAPDIALVNMSCEDQDCAHPQNSAFTAANVVVVVHAAK